MMTRWILVGLLVVSAVVIGVKHGAGSGPWKGEDFSAAMAQAAPAHQPVVAIIGADWCEFCHKLEDETMPDAKVKAALAKWKIVHVDGDSKSGKEITAKYGVDGFPTILFLDDRGNELNRVVGFVDADDMVKAVNSATKAM